MTDSSVDWPVVGTMRRYARRQRWARRERAVLRIEPGFARELID